MSSSRNPFIWGGGPTPHTNQPTSHPLNAHEGCAAEAEQAGVAAAAAAAEHQPQ